MMPTRHSRQLRLPRRQRGLTLIELMVAVVLALLITAAAAAALLLARQGYSSVDSTSQLREGGRFAATTIEKQVNEAGFENVAYGVVSASKDPGVRGYNNSLVPSTGLPGALAHGSRTSAACGSATGVTCLNGSDVLMLRFWGASRNGTADGTMVNCGGLSEPEGNIAVSESRAYSIFHVATGISGEPVLACTYRDPTSGTFTTTPLVEGVEGFQVLYGVYGVTAGTCSAVPQYQSDPPPDTYLRADQLDASGTYCANNWSRVRSIRIGLLLRGPVGSAPQRVAQTWNVLGDNYNNYATDTGTRLATPADGRLRQQLIFTVHLRNVQYTPVPPSP